MVLGEPSLKKLGLEKAEIGRWLERAQEQSTVRRQREGSEGGVFVSTLAPRGGVRACAQ